MIESTQDVGDILVWVFKIVPTYCLTDSIMYSSIKTTLHLIRPETKMDDFELNAIGGDVLLLMVHFIFWLLILVLIELDVFHCITSLPERFSNNKVKPREDLNLDEDVVEEENRVENTSPDQMKVRVKKFRKVYTSVFS